MKKILLTSFIISLSINSYSSTYIKGDPKPEQLKIILSTTTLQLSLNEFVKLKPKDYENRTGKKLSLKEFFFLKIAQRWIKKEMKKKGVVDSVMLQDKDKKPFKWHWGGFFLGLFLPFIGLLIAGIIKKDNRKWDRINSAAIATAIVSAVFLFIALKSIGNSL